MGSAVCGRQEESPCCFSGRANSGQAHGPKTRHRRQWKRWQIREAWRGHGQKPRMKTGSTAAVLWLQRPSLAFRQGQRPLTVDMSRLEGHDHTNNTATVHHLVHDGYGVSCSTPRWALAGRVITELALLLICLCYPLIRAQERLYITDTSNQPASLQARTVTVPIRKSRKKSSCAGTGSLQQLRRRLSAF